MCGKNCDTVITYKSNQAALKTPLFTLKLEIVNTLTNKMDCLIPNSFIFHYGVIETAMMVNIFEVKDCAMRRKRGRGQDVC